MGKMRGEKVNYSEEDIDREDEGGGELCRRGQCWGQQAAFNVECRISNPVPTSQSESDSKLNVEYRTGGQVLSKVVIASIL